MAMNWNKASKRDQVRRDLTEEADVIARLGNDPDNPDGVDTRTIREKLRDGDLR